MTKFFVNCGDLNTTITATSSGAAAKEAMQKWCYCDIRDFAGIIIVSDREIDDIGHNSQKIFPTRNLLGDMGILCECKDGHCQKKVLSNQTFGPRLCRNTIS